MSRIIDLAGHSAAYGGRLLVEAGHDVVRVEPRHGDAVRRLAPFIDASASLESSAFHHFLNAGKRSMTLSTDTPTGREVLRALLRTADAVIAPASVFQGPVAIDEQQLLADHPAQVIIKVVDDDLPELLAVARAGLLALAGYPDQRPYVLGGHVPLTVAGQYVALATATGLLSAQLTGRGGVTAVSVREALESLAEQAMTEYVFTGQVTKRRGARGQVSAVSGAFPTSDGHWIVSLGQSADGWKRFVEWVGDPSLLADADLALEEVRQEKKDELQDRIAEWSSRHPKEELVAEGQRRRIPAAPASTVSDLVRDPQLQARGYLAEVQHPEQGTVVVPRGAIATVLGTAACLGPRLGEHTAAILDELGYDRRQQDALVEGGVL